MIGSISAGKPSVPGCLTLELVEYRLAKTPLDHRMDGRALLLDEGLHPPLQLVDAALHGHREERQDLVEDGEVSGVEIPRAR